MDFDNFNINLALFDRVVEKVEPVQVKYWEPVQIVLPAIRGRGKKCAIEYVEKHGITVPKNALLVEPKMKVVPFNWMLGESKGKVGETRRRNKRKERDVEDSSSDYEGGRLDEESTWRPKKGWGYVDEPKVDRYATRLEEKTGLPFTEHKDALLNLILDM